MKKRPRISESDQNHIDELRSIVKEDLTKYYDTDFNLLRWLIGHNYKLDLIIPKLRNHLRFRKSGWDLDNITSKPRNHPVHSFWKSGLTGPALRTPHAIVNIEQTGYNDYWGMLSTFPVNELIRARVYDLETMLKKVMEMESETGERSSILYVMDLNGLKYDKRLITLLTGALASISAFMSDNYVELIHSFVLVNSPSFISMLWSIAKPLLPERTRRKVQIFGPGWRNEILNLAVPDALPTYWNNDEIDVFKANIERAQPIDPSSYYKTNPIENAQVLAIGAGQADFISVNAQKGQILKWLILSDGHFSCSVYFTEDANNNDVNSMKNVYPLFAKVPGPMIVPINEELYCEESGVYKLWFSNEHAFIHTLKILYKVDVE